MSLTFAYPWVLVALLIPLALLFLQWKNGTRPVPLPFDHQQVPHSRFWSVLLGLAQSLPALLLIVAVLLLAGPRTFERPRNERQLTNIQFLLDVSGSMMAEFGSGDRYDAAMESLNGFLDYRKGDAFSLMVFGSDRLRWVPLTTDVSAFRYAPPYLHPEKLPDWFGGGTEIGAALKQAREYLTFTAEGDRMIILLSDGWSSDLSGGEDVRISDQLAEDNITVYGIHIGEGTAPDEVSIICERTGGVVFSAGDPEALDAIFLRIDEMAKAPIKRLTPDPIDYFEPYALAGLTLAASYLLSLFTLRPTPW